MTQKYNFKFESATETVDLFVNRSTVLIANQTIKRLLATDIFGSVAGEPVDRFIEAVDRFIKFCLKMKLLRQETNRYLNVLNINF